MKFSEMPYERPDVDEMIKEGEAVAAGVRNAKSAGEALEWHAKYAEFYKKFVTLYSICYIRHTMNTKDEFYDGENDFFDDNQPHFEKIGVDFYREMLNSPFRAELKEALGELWFVNAEMRLKAFDEKIIGEMQQENALCSKFNKLLASAALDFNGEKVNLSQLRAYQLSKDRETRKAAYAKRTEFFIEHAKELDDIYDELVKLRAGMADKLGYSGYVELGYNQMTRNSYDAETVKRFREQVKRSLVPFLEELHEQRRKDLSVDKLKFYDEDVFFAEGNPAPKGTPEEMFEAGKKMYGELSRETSAFFDFMLEHELFDVLAKEGKSGGGYCTDLPDYDSPFVFANFNGTSEDVDVLTHECGHAFAYYLSRSVPILELQESTYDVAEIHSMSMEFFTGNWMRLFFEGDTKRFLYMQLAAALIFLPYGCMVDEFQHVMYDNPDMTPAGRKEAWLKLEAEYRPYIDFDGDPFFGKGGTWQRQSHIYERPFYYIDYCIAQTCALQYRVWMESDREAAWKSYIELLRKAGTGKLTDLIKEAGLKSPFEPDCIDTIIEGAARILKDYR